MYMIEYETAKIYFARKMRNIPHMYHYYEVKRNIKYPKGMLTTEDLAKILAEKMRIIDRRTANRIGKIPA